MALLLAVLAAASADRLEAAKAVLGTHTPTIVSFDIAAQPLTTALDAFSTATGLQLVYDGALARGRRSRPVVGAMSPEYALRELLEGTGLVPVRGDGAFTVMPADHFDPRKQTLAGLMPYLGAVQASIARAFCGWPQTRPGVYEVKLGFWIGPNGRIQQPHLIGSTADLSRDQSILRLMDNLAIQRPPPDLPQPIVIAISSRPPAQTGDCALVGRIPEGPAFPAQARTRDD